MTAARQLAVVVASAVAAAAAMLGLATTAAGVAVAEAARAPIVTLDNCACGGAVLVSRIELGGGQCLFTYDRGPGASPRYQSVQRSCG